MTKFINLEDVMNLIKDEDTVGVGGFCGFAAPDSILREIGRAYEKSGHPKALKIVTPAAAGDGTDDGWGLAALRADGLIDEIYTSVLTLPTALQKSASENKIACYMLPLGVFGHMFRALAGHEPGVLTHVGLHTYCDPREEGCLMNEKAKSSGKKLVDLITVGGKEYLFYNNVPMNVCIMRGTYADSEGNISIEHEAVWAETLEMALAVHNNGETVIFQVEKIVKAGSLDPRFVVVHKSTVDYVVLSKSGEHLQNYGFQDFRPELCGEAKIPLAHINPMDFDVRKIIARRAAMEIKKGELVNIGLGISDGVSLVANEEGLPIMMSIETGLMGGVPMSKIALGASVNPEAIYTMPETFDLYNGGGLDLSFLSAAQVDQKGNVNVSKFAGRIIGPGGFINISQNTHKMCFLGTFTAGKMDIRCHDKKLVIAQDGAHAKFVNHVEQITFSGQYALETGQDITYITERAVFKQESGGLILTEIAPGVNLERDILAKMDFVPAIADDLKCMDARIFCEEKMGLAYKS